MSIRWIKRTRLSNSSHFRTNWSLSKLYTTTLTSLHTHHGDCCYYPTVWITFVYFVNTHPRITWGQNNFANTKKIWSKHETQTFTRLVSILKQWFLTSKSFEEIQNYTDIDNFGGDWTVLPDLIERHSNSIPSDINKLIVMMGDPNRPLS